MIYGIKFLVECDWMESEELILPLEENLKKEKIEYSSIEDGYKQLSEKWQSLSWSFYGRASEFSLVEIYTTEEHEEYENQLTLDGFEKPSVYVLDNVSYSTCCEFDIIGFTEWMIDPELYNTPWDEKSNGHLFSCQLAIEAIRGSIYSKDFNFFTCTGCDREICEQNPANGWHVQYRVRDHEQICLQCHESEMFKNGIDLDKFLEERTLDDGMFFNRKELAEKGFVAHPELTYVEIGGGHISSTDPDDVFNKLERYREELEDKIVVIDFDALAIGGMGGYFTVYTKERNYENSRNTLQEI